MNEQAWSAQAAAEILTEAVVDIHEYAAEVPGSEKEDPAFNSWIADVAGKLAVSDEVHVHWATNCRGKNGIFFEPGAKAATKAGLLVNTLASHSVRPFSAPQL